MKLYIRIKDGVPFEHPILEENLKQAFPDLDVNNLPETFSAFERILQPELGPYEKYLGLEYERVNNVVRDKHIIVPMTEEEKIEKQNEVKEYWSKYGFKSWTFNIDTCKFEPPIPYPQDGKKYKWNEGTLAWNEITNN